jgi:uncharacterized protein
MRAYVVFILRHRWLVLGTVALLTALAGLGVSRARLSTNLGEQFMGDRPEYLRYLALSEEYASDEVVLVGLEGVDPFDPADAERLSRAARAVSAMPEIERVASPLDARRVRSDGDSLRMPRYVEEATTRPRERARIRAEALDDPAVGGVLLSRDGRDSILVAILRFAPERDGEAIPGIVRGVAARVEAAGFDRGQIHLGGYVVSLSESLEQLQYNVGALFPFVGLVLLALVWLLFHRLWPAALALGVALLGVTWTLGVMVTWQRSVHVMFSLFPPVILVVAFSDVVHLCSAYLIELGRGRGKEEAIIETTSDVGRACLLTSITTFIGFMSLAIVPDPGTRYLGVGLGLGVAVALILAMTLVPILFWMMPAPRPLREGATARVQGWMDRVLDGARGLAERRPRVIVTVFALVAVAALAGVPMANMDFDLSRRFAPDNPVTLDDHWFRERVGSGGSLDVFIHTPEAQGLWDPERLAAVARLQDELAALPQVSGVISLVDLVRRLHRQLADEPDAAATPDLPQTRAAIAQILVLLESDDDGDLARLVDLEYRSMRLRLGIVPGGARAVAGVGGEVERRAARVLPDDTRAEVSGLIYLLGYFFDQIFYAQGRGLTLSFFAIMLLMMLGVRSARVGALSMIPNLMPLLVLGGVAGLFFTTVDTDVLLIGIMAIGIGVDDTIHFLMRYKVEAARGGEPDAIIRQVFAFAGRGILMTTIILVLGFLPCATSGFMTMRLLGTFLPVCLVVALLADLLLVPAMIRLGWMRI